MKFLKVRRTDLVILFCLALAFAISAGEQENRGMVIRKAPSDIVAFQEAAQQILERTRQREAGRLLDSSANSDMGSSQAGTVVSPPIKVAELGPCSKSLREWLNVEDRVGGIAFMVPSVSWRTKHSQCELEAAEITKVSARALPHWIKSRTIVSSPGIRISVLNNPESRTLRELVDQRYEIIAAAREEMRLPLSKNTFEETVEQDHIKIVAENGRYGRVTISEYIDLSGAAVLAVYSYRFDSSLNVDQPWSHPIQLDQRRLEDISQVVRSIHAIEASESQEETSTAPEKEGGTPLPYWASQLQLPESIDVGRTPEDLSYDCDSWMLADRPITGVDSNIPFLDYIETVVAHEWGGPVDNNWHPNTHMAAALAAKTFALYRLAHRAPPAIRSGILESDDSTVVEFNILDNTCEQVFDPETDWGDEHESQVSNAVMLTKDLLLKRMDGSGLESGYHPSKIFYRDTAERCLESSPPCLPQRGSNDDAHLGLTWQNILNKYYDGFAGSHTVFHSIAEMTIGSDVQALGEVNIRESPTGQITGRAFAGNKGQIIEGYEEVSLGDLYFRFWKVQWEPPSPGSEGLIGWTADAFFTSDLGSSSPSSAEILESPSEDAPKIAYVGAYPGSSPYDYRLTLKVKNSGSRTLESFDVCWRQLIETNQPHCRARTTVQQLGVGEVAQVNLPFVSTVNLFSYEDPSLSLGIVEIPGNSISPPLGESTPSISVSLNTENLLRACVVPFNSNMLPGKCVAEVPELKFVELGGLRLDPLTNDLEFLLRSDRAESGDEPVDLIAAKEQIVKTFLQTLAVPNNKHWISLEIHSESGLAVVPSPFESTDMADAFLDADVAMKFQLFGESELTNESAIWVGLVQESQYWPILQAQNFSELPTWVMCTVIVPGEVRTAYQTADTIVIDEIQLDIDAGWWCAEPEIDLTDYDLPPEVEADLLTSLAQYKTILEDVVVDHAEEVVIPALNSPDGEPRFRRLRSIYSTIAIAHWYKQLAQQQGPSLPFADYIDTENLDGIEIVPPFDQEYWNEQAIQQLWEGPCTLFSGEGYCWMFGGTFLGYSEPTILGPLQGWQEDMTREVLEEFRIVDIAQKTYSFGSVIRANLPDLLVADVVVEPLRALPEEQISFQVNISNQGLIDVDAVDISISAFIVEEDGEHQIVIGERTINISANSTTIEEFDLTAPDILGAYWLVVQIDENSEIVESKETNNQLERTFNIVAPFPDVLIFLPLDGATLEPEEVLLLAGEGRDPIDGLIPDISTEWISSLDGSLGFGRNHLTSLSPGLHEITLKVTNSHGVESTATTTVIQQAPARTIAVAIQGRGEGSVISDPAGISCPPNCAGDFDTSTSVTLTALAEENSAIRNWVGTTSCFQQENCLLPSSDSDQLITAIFEPADQPLALALSRGGQGLHIYELDDQGQFVLSRTLPYGSFINSVDSGDLNTDGFVDLIATDNGWIRTYLNNGVGEFSQDSFPLISHPGFSGAHLEDYDRDSDRDVLVCDGSGPVDRRHVFYLNDGSGAFLSSGQSYGDWCIDGLTFGDFNADGFSDLIMRTASHDIQVFLNDQNGALIDHGVVGTNFSAQEMVAADFDEDGNLDLALCSIETAIFRNIGSAIFVDTGQRLASNSGSATTCAVGDFGKDGDLDLLISRGTTQIWENDGKGFFAPHTGFLGGDYMKVELADLNGDGHLDIVGVDPFEDSEIWINDGADTFFLSQTWEDSYFWHVEPFVAYPIRQVVVSVSGSGEVISQPESISCPSGSCSGEFGPITLTAIPDDGWEFAGWAGVQCDTEICAIDEPGNLEVSATFQPNRYDLNVLIEGDGSGDVVSSDGLIECPPLCTQPYPEDAEVALDPNPGPNSVSFR